MDLLDLTMLNKRHRWFMPSEVAIHNKPEDCWVIIHGRILDITSVIKENMNKCKCANCMCKDKQNPDEDICICADECLDICLCFCEGKCYCNPKQCALILLAFAGKDISHWFDKETGDFVTYTHPIISAVFLKPVHGVHCHLGPHVPTPKWRPVDYEWWRDDKRIVGKLTQKLRPLKIVNTLTSTSVTIDVCSEETLAEIMMRYYQHNGHMNAYTLRYKSRGLCPNFTLDQNGIPDERELFYDIGLPDDVHVPTILAFFNDDFTEDYPKPSLDEEKKEPRVNMCDYECVCGEGGE